MGFWGIKLKSKHVGVNTHRTNRIVEQALNDNLFKFIKKIQEIKREVKYGENSKIDFLVLILESFWGSESVLEKKGRTSENRPVV